MNTPAKAGRWVVGSGALLAMLLAAGAAAAQTGSQSDSRWQAFYGCWQPADAAAGEAAGAPAVCVVPAPGGVELLTVVDGAVADRERLEASGRQITREMDGCVGRETAEWSQHGLRVYRSIRYECTGGIERTATSLMSIAPDGEWVVAEGIAVGSQTGVRVLRHRPAATPAIPEVQQAFEGRALAMNTARLAAAAPLTLEEVVEATRRVDPAVVEGWLIEHEPRFRIDGSRLLQLAEAGVPESVIDLVVALSFPSKFAVDRTSREGELRPADASYARSPRRPVGSLMDPWYYPGYRFGGLYSPYGYYSGFGYPGYGYGWNSGRPSVIIIRDRDTQPQRGQAVKGRGYTSGGSSNAAPRATPDRSRASGGASGSTGAATGSTGSTGSAGSSSGTSSGSNSERPTAKPRGS
jgi:hypothetical protein